MIDASRSPRPLWKRIATVLFLVAAIVAAVWIVWVKELNHHEIHVHALASVNQTAIDGPVRALRQI